MFSLVRSLDFFIVEDKLCVVSIRLEYILCVGLTKVDSSLAVFSPFFFSSLDNIKREYKLDRGCQGYSTIIIPREEHVMNKKAAALYQNHIIGHG